jgi:hypothetical protein
MTPNAAPRLIGEDLTNMLQLVKDADSVELKLTVPEDAYRSTVVALGLDPLDAQIRQVFFLDTPDLKLNAAGVVARARRVKGREGDSVVKLRPVVPSELDPALRASPSFGVEVDAMPGGYVCSASMKGTRADKAVRASLSGEKPLHKLFSKEQRAFYADHAPADLSIDDLSILGPIFVLKLKVVPKAFTRPIVTELWLYPDGSRILELSTKCQPQEAVQVAIETRSYLEGAGADLGGDQATKTKTALEFYSAELRREAQGASS